MRKSLKSEFNSLTHYIQSKRNMTECYLLSKLDQYLKAINLFKEVKNLKFFLGALLYPKHMKNLYKSGAKQEMITRIHKSLYCFSIYNMEYLNGFPAYRVMLRYFLEKFKSVVFRDNKTIRECPEHYEKAFQFLENNAMASDVKSQL